MTKAILMKSILACLILSAQFSCAKKDPARTAPVAKTSNTKLDPKKAVTKTIEESATEASASAVSSDVTKAVAASADVTVAITPAKPVSMDSSKAVSSDKTQAKIKQAVNASADKTTTVVQAKPSATKPTDEVKKETEKTVILTLAIKNAVLLNKLSAEKKSVLYNSKLADSDTAFESLKSGNEDSFCSLSGDIVFESGKSVSIVDMSRELKNKEFDIYESKMTINSEDKKSVLNCMHTTNNFYIEQLAINFSEYFDVLNIDKQKYNVEKFVNQRTENRTLNAVKIKNLDALMKASATEDRKALASGLLIKEDESIELIKTGKERTTCIVSEITKNIDISKVYLRVSKIMGPDKYSEVIEQNTVYRADKENYFVLQCMMTKKTSQWSDLMIVAKGILEFGALDRNEYNKKYDEMKAIQNEIEGVKTN